MTLSTDTPTTLLGFDYGTKKIGIAVGQSITRTVTPLTTLANTKSTPDWSGIEKLVQEWQPSLLIVGLPLHMDGSEQEMTDLARTFANQLRQRYQKPVEMVDERLSSYEAELQLRSEQQLSGRKRRQTPQDIDKMAARLIIESWFTQHQK